MPSDSLPPLTVCPHVPCSCPDASVDVPAVRNVLLIVFFLLWLPSEVLVILTALGAMDFLSEFLPSCLPACPPACTLTSEVHAAPW